MSEPKPATVVDPHGDARFLLRPNATIRHLFADGSRIDIEFTDDGITIQDSSLTARRMFIEPVLANEVRVRSVPR